MTSLINYNNIDETFPIPGQDNNSQGFRDNFSAISGQLGIAAQEISALQAQVSVTGPAGTTGVNDQVDGYKPGDILLIPGTALGGASPANDLTLQVTQTQYPGDIKPYIIGEGIRSLACQVIKA